MMKVNVTIEKIYELDPNACEEGIAEFEFIHPDGITIKLTPEVAQRIEPTFFWWFYNAVMKSHARTPYNFSKSWDDNRAVAFGDLCNLDNWREKAKELLLC